MSLNAQPYPILEFDPERNAIFNPSVKPPALPIPERVVLCFFYDIVNAMAASGELVELCHLGSEIGPNPVYRLDTPGGPLTVVHPGVGAPLAAAFLEEVISLG